MLIGTLEDWKNAYAQGATPADLLDTLRSMANPGAVVKMMA